MDKKPKPSPDSKARASAIHAEIDQLTSGKANEKTADEKKAPLSPRDYIQQYMAEYDKKPDK
jgi:hypothetical protein